MTLEKMTDTESMTKGVASLQKKLNRREKQSKIKLS